MFRTALLPLLMLPGVALAHIPADAEPRAAQPFEISELRALPMLGDPAPVELLTCFLPTIAPEFTLPVMATATVSLDLQACDASG